MLMQVTQRFNFVAYTWCTTNILKSLLVAYIAHIESTESQDRGLRCRFDNDFCDVVNYRKNHCQFF